MDEVEDLRAVCQDLIKKCAVQPEDLVEQAYADLLEELPSGPAGVAGD